MRLRTFIQNLYEDDSRLVMVHEKTENVTIGRAGYMREIPVLIEPGAREMVGFLQRARHGEARAMLVRTPSKSEQVLVVWEAFEADHNEMAEVLRKNGWKTKGSPNLEFSAENRGYGSTNIARHGLVQYGPIWGTRSRIFAGTFIARMLVKLGNAENQSASASRPNPV